MAGIRIRWRGVARVAAIVVVALIALRLLPGFLRAPEPPPLGADVGLPRAAPTDGEEPKPVADTPRPGATDVPATRRRRHRRQRSRKAASRPAPDPPASTAVIGSRHRDRVVPGRASRPEKAAESTPPPPPEYVPPPAPEPIAEPLPEPPPAPRSTPGDGSQEFAPH